MTKRPLYAPPANVDDFNESVNPAGLRAAWHERVVDTISQQVTTEVLTGDPDEDAYLYPGQRSFFDALGSTRTPIPVPWFAFPQVLSAWYPDDDSKRWLAADTLVPFDVTPVELVHDEQHDTYKIKPGSAREPIQLFHRQQDEYCEWFTHTDPATGHVVQIDFTAENPDYWHEIATNDPELLLAKYREFVSPDVTREDLFWPYDVLDLRYGSPTVFAREGTYNAYNKWNTTHGAMHLTHPANNLFAEIVLAARATVQRPLPQDGSPHNARSLACCAGYGVVERSSDPTIGFTVNDAVSKGNRVGLADPVGLYIAKLDRTADGVWEVTRGSEEDKMILRASFTPSKDAVPLTYGGQIADGIQMNLYAIVEPNPGPPPVPERCETKCCTRPGLPSVQEAFNVSTDCNRLDDVWRRMAPYPRDAADPALDAVSDLAGDAPAEVDPTTPIPPYFATRTAR